jgi:hypothetical protein
LVVELLQLNAPRLEFIEGFPRSLSFLPQLAKLNVAFKPVGLLELGFDQRISELTFQFLKLEADSIK